MKTFLTILFSLTIAACGGGSDGTGDAAEPGSAPADPSGLTEAQLRNGVGPVTELEVGPLDEALAARGKEIYELKCSACHKIDERYVGPALGDVTIRRTPAFIMNMMLNPTEMTQRHPEARALLAEYAAPMADQNLTEDDARAILEYLRQAAN